MNDKDRNKFSPKIQSGRIVSGRDGIVKDIHNLINDILPPTTKSKIETRNSVYYKLENTQKHIRSYSNGINGISGRVSSNRNGNGNENAYGSDLRSPPMSPKELSKLSLLSSYRIETKNVTNSYNFFKPDNLLNLFTETSQNNNNNKNNKNNNDNTNRYSNESNFTSIKINELCSKIKSNCLTNGGVNSPTNKSSNF